MSLQDQIRFLEKFEQNLNRSSRTYRRYNANKQDHSFTVSKKALHAGITDALDIGLEGNKKKHELIPNIDLLEQFEKLFVQLQKLYFSLLFLCLVVT